VNLRRARYLVTLADEQNFTRAAANLRIAQSALSQQIKVLEREVGAILIQRKGPKFTLTAAGRTAVTEARFLLQSADRAIERIRLAANGSQGRLRIAFTRSWAGGIVADLTSDYRAKLPDVNVIVQRGPSAQNLELVQTGVVDAAFVRPPIDDTELTVIVLDCEPILVAVPSSHHLAAQTEVERAQLVGEPVVFWPRQNAPGMFDVTIDQLWPSEPPNIVRFEADDEAVLHAVAEGIGVAPMPHGRAHTLRVPGTHLCTVAGQPALLDVAIAFRPDNTNPVLPPLVDLVRAATTKNRSATSG
jgi:DNA-binding transcriptional LysR family regulator